MLRAARLLAHHLARQQVASPCAWHHHRMAASAAAKHEHGTVYKTIATGLKWTAVAGGVYYAGAMFVPSEYIRLAWLIPTRLARDVYTAGAIVLDYKTSLKPGLVGAEREEVLHACHQRGADRLLQLCFANGGIYTKLGQHIGQLDHMLPEEYVVTMRTHLLDSCPVSPYTEVRHIIMADLGSPPEQLFRSFSVNPVASASLAQVHVAEDHEGRKLAVKVQHAGLRESSAADIITVELLVKAAKLVFPDFDYQWLVDEIKHNLPLELNFEHEAANAERCRKNLKKGRSKLRHRVHVPHIYHDKTSARVLTMEFIDGAVATDLPELRRRGISPARLSRLISETFAEMIFIHGDVHADPHAANLLVRKKHGRMQLVLLDHGLYERLSDTFRLEYAKLWRALVYGDVAGIERSSKAMNAGDAVPLFAGMLTQRPWEEVSNVADMQGRLHIPRTQENREMVQRYATQYAREIAAMLVRVPREMLLLLKTNDCLRSVDNCLGQPVNNILVTARECTRALAQQQLAEARTPLQRVVSHTQAYWQVLRVELQLSALKWMMTWAWLKQCVGLLGKPPPKPEVIVVPV